MSTLREYFFCCFCGQYIRGFGNNPSPVVEDEEARRCNHCNAARVLPARLGSLWRRTGEAPS